ncbi:DNA gyrase subunit A [Hydrocarboniclastica marina]|uniref:DNA gyrase subunit A n=1 Tax=Hydrocarboniclastica marina TaxID=2259620 RepID=A0A4V1D8M7_9ALTE|nr:DNA gyrase subunit A [Hydrocarboniclastica marina]MAL98516.1 DNA gyrase subunit A [Alteromonadaceae bacterium]QCF25730.1 DNA gyrase subunit A [Hydrocarboniclastica marina]|tara:strand:+ start:2571 stop:5252 length:2682 start_codon:yes stop_codon:yes gene_type:complete
MGELAKEILPVNIEDELKQSYLDYAMSVIVGRALPDVRDGLKPVHRRVLFAMSELGNDWNKGYKKSARVVGDVIGKYHPHGDSAVYDTIVRMAQPFSLRYMLVDGQGNFGSIDGDSAAAMRYTEVRMAKISHSLLADLDKETVDFVPNYDGTEQIPEVMPTRVPNLLVNGSSGIAVGMATNIPPHNLGEVIDACLALIDDDNLTVDDLMEYIPGPDFPTAGIINGRAGIVEAYRTGRGRIYMRARYEFEHDKKTNRDAIIITELPYQLNKARLIEKIAELVKEKRIEGITELRDESNKEGIRVVIELRRNENPEVIINNLFAQTQLESVFGINMVALRDGRPQILNLKEVLDSFVRHRREVVTRRTIYELRKARERGHILEGLTVAISNIDPIIELIKASPSSAEAKERLIAKSWPPGNVTAMLERAGEDVCRPDDLPEYYGMRNGEYFLSPEQAQAILDLRLHRLTGLETEKLFTEYKAIVEKIAELLHILGDPDRLLEVIREELIAVKEEYNDKRRTEITSSRRDLTVADLIDEQDLVVTISHGGYAKTQPVEDYQAQRRGGRGKSATSMKDEDFIEKLLVANSHDTILCFTNKGKVYWLRVFEIPQASRSSRGRPMVNILPLDEGERITSFLAVRDYPEDHFVLMATAFGTIKKTPLVSFSRPRSNGLIALNLDEGDHLIGTAITDGTAEIMLFSTAGKAIRFHEDQVRAMGRTARGVRGIRLGKGQEVVSLIIPNPDGLVLTASLHGYGKRSKLDEFPRYGRGSQGVIGMQCSDRNGPLVTALQVFEGDEMMLITDKGTLVRTRTEEVSVLSRNTQGVRLIKLSQEDEKLVGVERIEEPEEEELEEGAVDTPVEAAEGEATIPADEADLDQSGSGDADEGGAADPDEEI